MRKFMREFISADVPCFALGVVEERERRCGLLALRPGRVIPSDVANAGFRFGHTLLGNANFVVVHFAFEFCGFETYNALVNPNNPLVKLSPLFGVVSRRYMDELSAFPESGPQASIGSVPFAATEDLRAGARAW